MMRTLFLLDSSELNNWLSELIANLSFAVVGLLTVDCPEPKDASSTEAFEVGKKDCAEKLQIEK